MTQLAKPCALPKGAEVLTLSQTKDLQNQPQKTDFTFERRSASLEVGHQGMPVSVIYWAEAMQEGPELISFLTSDNKLEPSNQPILLLVHGLSGTTVWLDEMAQQFAQTGIKVLGIELPEIGIHDSGIGDFSDRHLLIQRVCDTVSSLYHLTGKPIWLMGLSLGGLLAAHAAAKQPQGLEALGLIAPAFKASSITFEPTYYLEAVCRRLGECLGLQKTGYPMPIPFAKDQTTISRMPEQVTMMSDTCNRVLSLTPRAAVQLIKMTLMDTPKVIPQILCPVRLYVSQTDAICDAPTMIEQFARFGTNDKRLVVFPEARHDLTLEPEMPLLVNHFLKSMQYDPHLKHVQPSPAIKNG